MTLSKRSLETLLDLVEIRLSCVEIWDRDDAREVKVLQAARKELLGLNGGDGSTEMPAMEMPRRRGRPRSNPVMQGATA